MVAATLLSLYLFLAFYQAWKFQLTRHGASVLVLVALILILYILCKPSRRHLPYIVIIPPLLVLIWAVFVQPHQISDFAAFLEHSRAWAQEPNLQILHASKSAPTVLVFGFIFWLVGSGAPVIWTIGSALHGLQTYLVFRVATGIFDEEVLSVRAAAIYGFLPALIGYSPVLSSEGVFLTLTLAGLVALLVWQRSPDIPLVLAVAGVALGAAFLTRAPGLAFILGGAGFVVANLSSTTSAKNTLRGLGLFSASLAVVLAPQLALNVHYGDSWSVNGSQYSSLSILFGTNRETRGGFSMEDLQLIGWDSAVTTAERSEAYARARDLGRERIRSDVPGFLVFALTDKVGRLWEQEYGTIVRYSLTNDSATPIDGRAVGRVVDSFYVAVLSLGLIGCVGYAARLRAQREPVGSMYVALLVVPALALAAIHMVLEVQGRYHLSFMPMLVILAAVGAQTLRGGLAKVQYSLKK